MKPCMNVLLAGLLAFTAAGTVSAQVRVGIYTGTPQPYYPPFVEVQPRYIVPAPHYDDDQEMYVEPGWQARREWRERRAWRRAQWLRREEWRREEWRRQQWRREQWRNEQRRHDRRDWDDRDDRD